LEALKKFGNIIIFGASSGVGLAAAEFFKERCSNLYTISRRPSPHGTWIKTDVTKLQEIENLHNIIGDLAVDALLYLGGTWETNAFTKDYSFESCSDQDIENVLNVNLLAPIRVIQKFLPNLKKSKNPRIIIMGAALDSLDHIPYSEVANVSSKYGLKGTIAALRQSLKDYKIGISLVNPGYIATEEVLEDLKSSGKDESNAIPMNDLFLIFETILKLSNQTNINELDVPNM